MVYTVQCEIIRDATNESYVSLVDKNVVGKRYINLFTKINENEINLISSSIGYGAPANDRTRTITTP